MHGSRRRVSCLLLAAGLAAAATTAKAAIIDANDIAGVTHGTVVTTQIPGVTISASGGPNLAVAFDTSLMPTRDPDLEDPFGAPTGPLPPSVIAGPTNPGFIFIVQENGTGCGDGTCDNPDDRASGPNTIAFDFGAMRVRVESIDLFDLDGGSQGETATITLLDGGFNEIISGSFVGDGNSVTVDLVSLFDPISTSNVRRLEVAFSSSGATNNLVYYVPGPSTLLVFAFGLLGAGVAARRLRRSAARGR